MQVVLEEQYSDGLPQPLHEPAVSSCWSGTVPDPSGQAAGLTAGIVEGWSFGVPDDMLRCIASNTGPVEGLALSPSVRR